QATIRLFGFLPVLSSLVRVNSSAREKMRLSESEQIYAEQRPISSGNFATAVASLRRAPKQVRQQGARQESGPRFVAAACQQSNKTPTKERRKRLPPIRPSKNVRPKRYG